MRDDQTMPPSTRVIDATRGLVSGRTGIAAAASLAIIAIAGLVAPGAAPSPWVWARVVAIWLLAAIAFASIAEVASGKASRPVSPLIVWGALLLAVLISLTFTPLAVSLTVLILVLSLLVLQSGRSTQLVTFWTVMAVLLPLWVWSAFEAWDRWLLMLVPLGAVALISLEHANRSGRDGFEPGERLAAWIGIVALAAIELATVLLADIDPSWATLGAAIVAALAGVDIARSSVPLAMRIPSVMLPAMALAVLALAWLAAL
jgi:hypothetical protein